MQLEYTYMQSAVGQLLLAGEGKVLYYLGFPMGKMPLSPASDWIFNRLAFKSIRRQIEAYFAGECKQFDIAIAPFGT